MSDTKLCPFCAEEIKSAAIKCKHCGEMLAERPTSSAAPQFEQQPSAPAATQETPSNAPASALISQTELGLGDGELIYEKDSISITPRVITVGKEALQVANINSVRILGVPGVNYDSVGKSCGGCAGCFGVFALLISFSSLGNINGSSAQSHAAWEGFWIWFLLGFLALVLAGICLKEWEPHPAAPATWTVQLFQGNIPRDLAKGLCKEDAEELEKAVKEAFQRLRTAR